MISYDFNIIFKLHSKINSQYYFNMKCYNNYTYCNVGIISQICFIYYLNNRIYIIMLLTNEIS